MKTEDDAELTLAAEELPAPWLASASKASLITALRRGDRDGVLHAFGIAPNACGERVQQMAALLIEWRRMSVATIGAHEVFHRRTEVGDLKQVVAPVKLSLSDGTLYRMPAKHERRLKSDPSRFASRTAKPYEVLWVPVYDDPMEARLTAAGYNRLNEVAGCSVALPDTVAVDGRREGNPYVARTDDDDLRRIVLQVNVAGPAPLTGNIVVVQYVLDLDVRADLLQMLMNIAKNQSWRNKQDADHPDAPIEDDAAGGGSDPVQLVPRGAFDAFAAERPGYWHWLPLYGGVGLAHNLGHPEVRKSYDKYISLLENAYRKAQTIARRNAMRMHPALSHQVVRLNSEADPSCTVRGVGWTMSDADTDRYTRALDQLARGEVAPDVEVVEHRHAYDPVADNERPFDAPEPTDEGEAEAETEAEAEASREVQELNAIRAEIDEIVLDLSGRAIQAIGYPPPAGASWGALLEMLSAAEAARSE